MGLAEQFLTGYEEERGFKNFQTLVIIESNGEKIIDFLIDFIYEIFEAEYLSCQNPLLGFQKEKNERKFFKQIFLGWNSNYFHLKSFS